MKHVINISGGKDSTALWILARLERGLDVIPVFADTGHELPATYEYVHYLADILGPVRKVRADFSAQIARKRKYIADHWLQEGVAEERARLALKYLHPTGNPFLDLCLLKGRFPSTRARFCSAELKNRPIYEQVIEPLLNHALEYETGDQVVSWIGVRADESRNRADLDVVDEDRDTGLIHYRPLICYTADQVFDLHRRHGIQPNPLYTQGMSRVGCMPCIHANKNELAEIARRWPSEFDRVAKWEGLVGQVSKRGVSTFFSYDKTPGDHQTDTTLPMPNIYEVARWAKTSRGGKQFPLFDDRQPVQECSSVYGLCE